MSAVWRNILGREFGWAARRRVVRIVLILFLFVIPGVCALIVKTLKESAGRDSLPSSVVFEEPGSAGMFRDNVKDWVVDSEKHGPFRPHFGRTHRMEAWHQSGPDVSLFEQANHLVERSHNAYSFPHSLAYENSGDSKKKVLSPFAEPHEIRLNPTLYRPGQSGSQFSNRSAARSGRGVLGKKEASESAFSRKIADTKAEASRNSDDSPKVRTGIRVIEPNSGVSEKVTAGKIRNISSGASALGGSAAVGNEGGNMRLGVDSGTTSQTNDRGIREFRPVKERVNSSSNNSDSPLSSGAEEKERDRRRGYLPPRGIGSGLLGGGLLAAGIAANENGGAAAVPLAGAGIATVPVGRSGRGFSGGSDNGPGSNSGGLNGGGNGANGSGGTGGAGSDSGMNSGGPGTSGSGSSLAGTAPLAAGVGAGAGGATAGGVPLIVPPPVGGMGNGNDVPISEVPDEQESPKKKKRSKVIYWIVQPNQTIESLAASVSCPAEDIRALNKISILVPGQTILLPVKRVESRTWTQ